MKYFPLILFALFIDGLQFLLMLGFIAFEFVTPVGGGVGGALAGCYANASAWYDVSGCIQGATVGGAVGAAVSTFAVPLGIAVDIALTLTFGSALVLSLVWLGLFSPGTVLGFFLGETVPLLDIFPGWTLMVWRCIHIKNVADRHKAKKTAVQANTAVRNSPFNDIRPAGTPPYGQVA